MSELKTVFCAKYKQQLPALDTIPMPGEHGEWLVKNVSKKAWEEWVKIQTRLINERMLKVRDPKTRQWLQAQQHNFFTGEKYEDATGYKPIDK